MEFLIDVTTGYETLSFMDEYSGYNQIKMHPDDAEITAFRSPKRVFYYQVMPFVLKNAGATYQRAMTVIFKKMLGDMLSAMLMTWLLNYRRGSIT